MVGLLCQVKMKSPPRLEPLGSPFDRGSPFWQAEHRDEAVRSARLNVQLRFNACSLKLHEIGDALIVEDVTARERDVGRGHTR